MILTIRISGMVEVDRDIQETLNRMRLRRKYSAVLLRDTPENLKLLKKVRNFVAYGRIDEKSLCELIEKRAKTIGKKKADAKKIIEEIHSQLQKDRLDFKALGIKPFFRLHPPRKGIDTKKHFGKNKGVLGDNGEKINELLRRML